MILNTVWLNRPIINATMNYQTKHTYIWQFRSIERANRTKSIVQIVKSFREIHNLCSVNSESQKCVRKIVFLVFYSLQKRKDCISTNTDENRVQVIWAFCTIVFIKIESQKGNRSKSYKIKVIDMLVLVLFLKVKFYIFFVLQKFFFYILCNF